MIKRRFYNSSDSDSSSSSSDSDSDSIPEAEEEEEEVEKKEDDADEVAIEVDKSEKKRKRKKRDNRSPSPGSGYESEDSSVNEVNVDSSGLLASEEESIERGSEHLKDGQSIRQAAAKDIHEGASKTTDGTLNSDDHIQAELADCILKCKSAFKCRLCPRIVCLSEDTVKAHLTSKRHARSKKLFGEGRLKLMLNSDGEVEELEGETHAERHIRTVTLAAESAVASVKKDSGRQRQSLRRKKKQSRSRSNNIKREGSAKSRRKKQRKNEA